MASKTMRCSYCRTQIVVPPYAHAIQCAVCQTIIRFQPNIQTHNSFSQRSKNMLHTASNNTKASIKSYSGSGISDSVNFPQQARPSPPVVPVSVHGRKRAVLCGISYYGQRYKLDGTVNDVKSMRYFLTQRLGFPSDSILTLTEEESDPSLIPTGNNIRKALKWLVQGCQSGDSLVFHYSGHGSQQLDFNRDEVDGYDEIIWPVDYQTEGTILDDEINATIVRPLPRGATLHAIIDACHSGTILDLPFVCRINREGYYKWEDHRLPYTAYKGTNGGYAISISACDDNQSSGDTTAFTGKATGALTYSFLKTLEQEPGVTYGYLLMAMHKIIGAARGELGLSSNLSHLLQGRAGKSMHGHGKQEREMQFLRHANIGASLHTCYLVCSMSNYHPPQHNDPFGQTHNSIFCATNRLKDMPHTASSNTNMMVPRMNNYSSGTSGFGYYPEQARFSEPGVPVSAHGRKRAVLCGVSYYGQRCRLNGTVNDVKCMRNFLIQRLAFPSDSILILTGKRVSE